MLWVNSVFRYEHRDEHLEILSDRLGFKVQLKASEGRSTRRNRRDYAESYSDWSQEFVGDYFKEELALLRCELHKPTPSDVVTRPTAEELPVSGNFDVSSKRAA